MGRAWSEGAEYLNIIYISFIFLIHACTSQAAAPAAGWQFRRIRCLHRTVSRRNVSLCLSIFLKNSRSYYLTGLYYESEGNRENEWRRGRRWPALQCNVILCSCCCCCCRRSSVSRAVHILAKWNIIMQGTIAHCLSNRTRTVRKSNKQKLE